MTLPQIHATLEHAGKPLGRARLYVYLSRLNIKPAIRLRPANYPPDTADRLLQYLGFESPSPTRTKIPTMRQLRSVRANAKGGRR